MEKGERVENQECSAHIVKIQESLTFMESTPGSFLHWVHSLEGEAAFPSRIGLKGDFIS